MNRVLHRFALTVRAGLLVSYAVLIVISTRSEQFWLAVGVSSLLVAWSVALFLRARKARAGLIALAADIGMTVLVCFSPVWAGLTDEIGWVLAVTVLTVIASQYSMSVGPAHGLGLAAVAAAAYVSGNVLLGNGVVLALLFGMRLFVEGVLARCSYWLMRSYARIADRFIEQRTLRRRETGVARARRRAELDHLATLHDTASATLLMIATSGGRRLDWVPGRARDDLQVLRSAPEISEGRMDLVQMVRSVLDHALPVEATLPDRVELPGGVVLAIVGGLREALSNVVRHAEVDHAELSVERDQRGAVTVLLTDRGRGFDTGSVPDGAFGVSGSIVGRMREVGGSASVRSEAGAGTQVRWHWAPAPDVEERDVARRTSSGRQIRARLLLGLRIALLVVALGVQFAFCLAQLTGYSDVYYALWPEVLAFGLLLITGGAEAWSVISGRTWPEWWRWTALGVVGLAAVLGTVVVPPEDLFRTAHWSFGLIGWYGVLLLFDRPVKYLVWFFAGCVALTSIVPFVHGTPSRAAVAMMITLSISVYGYQLAVGLLGQRLQAVATTVERAADEAEKLRTDQVIAERTHHDHRERYSALQATTVPLLAGLADGDLDPSDECVRERCALEATRVRRLLAEGGDHGDPLLHELSSCVDLVERNGVPVELAVRGRPIPLDREVRRAMIEPLLVVLSQVRRQARVTVLRTDEQVRVSVLGDASDTEAIHSASRHVEVSKLVNGEKLWVTAATKATVG